MTSKRRASRLPLAGLAIVAALALSAYTVNAQPTLALSAATVAAQPAPPRAAATLRLPRIFGDGMVLQRGKPVPVWGWAETGAAISVVFRGHTARATTAADGSWRTTLPATSAGGPFDLSIRSATSRIDLHDVMVGDVWVASGQSNMEFTVAQGYNADREIADARDAGIRQFKVPTSWANAPEDDLAGGEWSRADAQHVGAFSGVAYFFARDVRRSINVPIGIINTTWGGSNIETWTDRRAQHLGDSAWAALLGAEEARDKAVRDSLRAKLGGLPAIDSGLVDGRALWAAPALDDAGWTPIAVPGYWERSGYPGMDGVAWYRVAFELTDSDMAAGVSVLLAAIDDDDITWVNGVEIGRTNGYNVARRYRVPANALHAGRNVLVVRVADGGGGGGINGAAALAFGDGTQRALAGTWKFKVAQVSFAPDGQRVNKVPSILYNKMVHPLLPFAIKGVLWYQGESNANNVQQAAAYRGQFVTLIESWRRAWGPGREPLPFLWVQLPNFGPPDSVPPATATWATQRESMAAALALPNTGQAIAIDIGEGELHPRNKQDVGARLARVALRKVYGLPIVASGPTYQSHVVKGDSLIITFRGATGGLHNGASSDTANATVRGFAIAGADHRFVWANARIAGDRVIVWSERVRQPIAVRYAWANNPDQANLRNGERLPAEPFRTDRWEQQPAPPEAKPWTTQDDHRNMMEQLGIRALRPGPSGNDADPNHANYDEAKANPFPKLPDVLTLKNGRRVTSVRQWSRRRAEIVEDFEREVLGRVPRNVPKVRWSVIATDTGTVAGRRVVGKQLTGHVDNAAYPAISVDISLTLVLPADAASAPVMILFGGRPLAQAVGRPAPPPPVGARSFSFPPPAPGSDAPGTEQLVVDGWGFAFVNPGSIQADNGAGLTKGIIGLVNKGRPRKPDDWGALRAWAWGASRALDYLHTEKGVNARQVGIEGVSRYGKAALVTMAFDERFAVALISSSGEGGTKLHRRNWGEAVESLTGSGEYHWMAGNFMKYGASDATFGSRNAGDLPVDAHELLALCAPRLTFISHGVPEKGDAKWLDHQGSFMAAIASQPVFRLLGAKDLGRSDDYTAERMPAVNVGLLDGRLAWRQHDGGHTDAPNWKYFIEWADRFFARPYKPAPPVSAAARDDRAMAPRQAPWPADKATPRTDSNSMLAHRQLLEKRTKGRIDLYFLGNSIVRRWGATDYPQMLANWNANFFGWNAADFGWGADRIEHMLWRIENGELDGVNPKVIVLLAGTNNVGSRPGDEAKVADITRGIRALIDLCRTKAPNATIVLTAIFPRNDNPAVVPEINRINENIARFADGRTIRFVNINDKLADAGGVLVDGMTVDKLHPTVKGYQVWADALKPILTELLGPPASVDLAPPPTGDPSARKP